MSQRRISDLKRAIKAVHGVESRLIAAERVVYREGETTVWEGDVLVFSLLSHPVASKCYVWEMQGKVEAVLHAPLVSTPEAAVRAAMGRSAERLDGAQTGGGPVYTSEVTLVARIEAKPGFHHLVREELVKLLAPTRSEPGCTRFQLHQALDDPAIFLFYETWRSEEDFERYLVSPHFTAWCLGCEDLLARRPEVSRWYLVA